jgi:hypothetical protein
MDKSLEKHLALTNAWMNGALRGTAYTMGARYLKAFIKNMAEVFTESFAEKMSELGSPLAEAGDPVEAVKDFGRLENDIGGMAEGHLEVEKVDEDHIKVTFNDCYHSEVCSAVLGEMVESGKFDKNALPCIRADVCLSAAVRTSSRKGRYMLNQFAPGFKCVSTIEFL